MSKENTSQERLSLERLKVVRSYRLSPEAIALVQQAVDESGASQGDILEACIMTSIREVSDRLARERREREAKRAAALAAVTKRPPGRPRKSAGLKLRQQQ